MSDEFVFVYRADNGEQVRIPRAHLEIFAGAFTTDPPQQAEDRKGRKAADTPPAGTTERN